MREKCDNTIKINIRINGEYISVPYDCEKCKGHKGNHLKVGDAYKVEWENGWESRKRVEPRPLELTDKVTNKSLSADDRRSLYNKDELANIPNLFNT